MRYRISVWTFDIKLFMQTYHISVAYVEKFSAISRSHGFQSISSPFFRSIIFLGKRTLYRFLRNVRKSLKSKNFYIPLKSIFVDSFSCWSTFHHEYLWSLFDQYLSLFSYISAREKEVLGIIMIFLFTQRKAFNSKRLNFKIKLLACLCLFQSIFIHCDCQTNESLKNEG